MEQHASEIPRKEFYKLSELCEYTDVQPYVVRFWESEFPQLCPEKRGGTQPLYRLEHIELVRRIKQLLHEEECTLAAARQKLGEELEAGALPTQVGGLFEADAVPARESPIHAGHAADERVPRQRYEDAIDEIDTLRLQVREAEKLRRKAELAAKEACERAEQLRLQTLKASARLEKLLAGLEH